MPRARLALSLTGLLSIAMSALGVSLFFDRKCDGGGDCNDEIIAWLLGFPLAIGGIVLLIVAVRGWRRASRAIAFATCMGWAAVLALIAFVAGISGLTGVLVALLAVAVAALGAWARREPSRASP